MDIILNVSLILFAWVMVGCMTIILAKRILGIGGCFKPLVFIFWPFVWIAMFVKIAYDA